LKEALNFITDICINGKWLYTYAKSGMFLKIIFTMPALRKNFFNVELKSWWAWLISLKWTPHAVQTKTPH